MTNTVWQQQLAQFSQLFPADLNLPFIPLHIEDTRTIRLRVQMQEPQHGVAAKKHHRVRERMRERWRKRKEERGRWDWVRGMWTRFHSVAVLQCSFRVSLFSFIITLVWCLYSSYPAPLFSLYCLLLWHTTPFLINESLCVLLLSHCLSEKQWSKRSQKKKQVFLPCCDVSWGATPPGGRFVRAQPSTHAHTHTPSRVSS